MSAGVAGRYARALFDLARDHGLIDQFARELQGIRAFLDGHPEVDRILDDRLVAIKDKKEIIDRAFPRPLHQYVINFLHLLADKRREERLRDIIGAYGRLVDAHNGVIEVDVTSAVPLGPDEESRLGRALERAAGKRVRLRKNVDKAIVGGLVVRIDDRLYDGSVRSQLRKLRREMAGAGQGANPSPSLGVKI